MSSPVSSPVSSPIRSPRMSGRASPRTSPQRTTGPVTRSKTARAGKSASVPSPVGSPVSSPVRSPRRAGRSGAGSVVPVAPGSSSDDEPLPQLKLKRGKTPTDINNIIMASPVIDLPLSGQTIEHRPTKDDIELYNRQYKYLNSCGIAKALVPLPRSRKGFFKETLNADNEKEIDSDFDCRAVSLVEKIDMEILAGEFPNVNILNTKKMMDKLIDAVDKFVFDMNSSDRPKQLISMITKLRKDLILQLQEIDLRFANKMTRIMFGPSVEMFMANTEALGNGNPQTEEEAAAYKSSIKKMFSKKMTLTDSTASEYLALVVLRGRIYYALELLDDYDRKIDAIINTAVSKTYYKNSNSSPTKVLLKPEAMVLFNSPQEVARSDIVSLIRKYWVPEGTSTKEVVDSDGVVLTKRSPYATGVGSGIQQQYLVDKNLRQVLEIPEFEIKYKQQEDAQGNPVFTAQQRPVLATDDNGKLIPLLDSEGRVILQLDKNGQPVPIKTLTYTSVQRYISNAYISVVE